MSKIKLELHIAELRVSGFGDADGRVLRHYRSGQSRMAWDTLQRLVLWALTKVWIPGWFFEISLKKWIDREAIARSIKENEWPRIILSP